MKRLKKVLKSIYYSVLFNFIMMPVESLKLCFLLLKLKLLRKGSIIVYLSATFDVKYCACFMRKLAEDNNNIVIYLFKSKISPDTRQHLKKQGISVIIGLHRILPKVSCTIFLTTSSGFKLIPKCRKSIYFFHSLVSIDAAYPDNEFLQFNTYLCAGKHHKMELMELHRRKKLPVDEKVFVEAGYPRIEELRKFRIGDKSKTNTILYAPTWGMNSSLALKGPQIVDSLTESGCGKVILRPHPMSFTTEKEVIESILEKHKGNPNFILDDSDDGDETLSQAGCLITDWSGIAFEYALAFRRPVLFLNTPIKNNNESFKGDGTTLFEYKYRSHIGEVIQIDDLRDAVKDISHLKEPDYGAVESVIYNFLNSKETIYNYISDLLNGGKRNEM